MWTDDVIAGHGHTLTRDTRTRRRLTGCSPALSPAAVRRRAAVPRLLRRRCLAGESGPIWRPAVISTVPTLTQPHAPSRLQHRPVNKGRLPAWGASEHAVAELDMTATRGRVGKSSTPCCSTLARPRAVQRPRGRARPARTVSGHAMARVALRAATLSQSLRRMFSGLRCASGGI